MLYNKNPSSHEFFLHIFSQTFFFIQFYALLCVNLEVQCEVWKFMHLHMDIQLFQQHLLKKITLFCSIAFVSLVKINFLYMCECLSGLYVLFHWLIFFCMFSPYYIVLQCSFIIRLEDRLYQFSNLVLCKVVQTILDLCISM